jgi:hypothetical protein
VFDEFFVRDTNTPAVLEMLAARYSSHRAGVRFFGDATGRARKTSASMTDYAHIKNFDKLRDSQVFFPSSNPAKHDRFAACNAMFCNADNKRRCKVHPRCVNLLKDLDSRAYKSGSNEVDDHDDIGHITDALGYLIHLLFPITFKIFDREPEILLA